MKASEKNHPSTRNLNRFLRDKSLGINSEIVGPNHGTTNGGGIISTLGCRGNAHYLQIFIPNENA